MGLPLVTFNRLHPQAIYASDFSLKRVVLHAVCLLRRPEKAAFFFAGCATFSAIKLPDTPRRSEARPR